MTADTAGGPSFAIAFGGGGARGLAHIHVIEALDAMPKPVVAALYGTPLSSSCRRLTFSPSIFGTPYDTQKRARWR